MKTFEGYGMITTKSNTRKAFTMIELIFVIVILGILSSIAISKMAVTRDDAMFTKGKGDISAIRSTIALVHSTTLLSGNSGYPATLDDATANAENEELFDGNSTKLLDYPIRSENTNGHWMKTGAYTYNFKVMNNDVEFTYNPNDGTFNCDHSDKNCNLLTR